MLLLCTTSWAWRISGVVTDVNGETMPYATVMLEGERRSTVTDAMGRYLLDDVASGKHTLKVTFIGFKTLTHTLNVTADVVYNARISEESVTLDEYVVKQGGVPFSRNVMNQLEKNIKPLKKRIASYDCVTTGFLEKNIPLSELKKRRTIRFGLMMIGWGKVFDVLVKYDKISMRMSENVQFRKGKIKSSEPHIISLSPKMTDSEIKSITKKDWFLDDNTYDRFYDNVKDKIKSLKKKNSKYDVTYCGRYTEGKHTVYILKYGHTQVDVVAGCWQIRRMKYKSGSRTIYFEFEELSPNVFMPISGHAEFDIDYEGYPKGTVKMSLGYNYKSIKAY